MAERQSPLPERGPRGGFPGERKRIALKKKLFSLLLAVVMVVSAAPAALAATPFRDLEQGAWYIPAVNYVYEKGLFGGVSATEFAPNQPMTRAMFVKVLANNTANFAPYDGSTPFTDVRPGDWYYDAVNWAYQNVIVNGVSETRFDPGANVTREQMVTMLYKYAVGIGADTLIDSDRWKQYRDFSAVSGYARTPMRWALGKGIINGVTADTLKPKANALRCEVARMFQNAAFLLPPGSSTVSPESKPDPALPMVRALRLSHRQLRAWGAVETDSMSGDYQSMVVRYKLFPELDFYLPYTTLDDSSMPEAVVGTLDQVFPRIVGRSVGTAANYLGGNFSLLYHPFPDYPQEGWYEVAYRTENCRFYISMMKPDRFSASDIIEIQPLKPLTPSVPESGPARIQDYLDCLDLTLYEAMQKYGVTPDDSYYAYMGDRITFESLPGANYTCPNLRASKYSRNYAYLDEPLSGVTAAAELLIPELVGTPYGDYDASPTDYSGIFHFERDGYTYFVKFSRNPEELIPADAEVSVFLNRS